MMKPIRAYFSSDKQLQKSLHNLLGFYPTNIALYQLAFRHRSVAEEIGNGIKNSNERLEFLGDSIIDSVVAEYLFKKYPFKAEGFLTKMRSKLVSRERHNQIAAKLGLGQFVKVNNILNIKNAINDLDIVIIILINFFLYLGGNIQKYAANKNKKI